MATHERMMKGYQSEDRYPLLSRILMVRGDLQWEHFTSEQLTLIENILTRHPGLDNLIIVHRRHPTLNELLLLNQAPGGIARVFQFLDNKDASSLRRLFFFADRCLDTSQIFIDIMKLEQPQYERLIRVVSDCPPIELQLRRNILKISRYFALTKHQASTLLNPKMNALMRAGGPLSIESALRLTPEQVAHLETDAIWTAVNCRRIPDAVVGLNISTTFSEQDIERLKAYKVEEAMAMQAKYPHNSLEKWIQIVFLPPFIHENLKENLDKTKLNLLARTVLKLPQHDMITLISRPDIWLELCFRDNALSIDYLLSLTDSHLQYMETLYADEKMKAAIHAGEFPKLYADAHPMPATSTNENAKPDVTETSALTQTQPTQPAHSNKDTQPNTTETSAPTQTQPTPSVGSRDDNKPNTSETSAATQTLQDSAAQGSNRIQQLIQMHVTNTRAPNQTQPTQSASSREDAKPSKTETRATPQPTHPVQQLIQMIDAYTQRIDRNKVTKHYSKFESDFWFMNKSRGANRKATYDALKALREELVGYQNCELSEVPAACSTLFSDQHIKSLRPSVAKPHPDRGINSDTVKRLLKAGKQFADPGRNFSRT